jgi:hypothetical protein
MSDTATSETGVTANSTPAGGANTATVESSSHLNNAEASHNEAAPINPVINSSFIVFQRQYARAMARKNIFMDESTTTTLLQLLTYLLETMRTDREPKDMCSELYNLFPPSEIFCSGILSERLFHFELFKYLKLLGLQAPADATNYRFALAYMLYRSHVFNIESTEEENSRELYDKAANRVETYEKERMGGIGPSEGRLANVLVMNDPGNTTRSNIQCSGIQAAITQDARQGNAVEQQRNKLNEPAIQQLHQKQAVTGTYAAPNPYYLQSHMRPVQFSTPTQEQPSGLTNHVQNVARDDHTQPIQLQTTITGQRSNSNAPASQPVSTFHAPTSVPRDKQATAVQMRFKDAKSKYGATSGQVLYEHLANYRMMMRDIGVTDLDQLQWTHHLYQGAALSYFLEFVQPKATTFEESATLMTSRFNGRPHQARILSVLKSISFRAEIAKGTTENVALENIRNLIS